MMYAADFREKARISLQGNWGKAVGVGFVAALLGAGTTSAAGGTGVQFDSGDIETISELNGVIPTEFQITYLAILSILAFTALVFGLIHFFVGGAATLGYVKFNLNLVDKKTASFADLFSEFHRFGAGFVMQLLRGIYTFLWTLLFIIPGIYAAYGYAMAPYILMENPEMTANEAITKSKEMMHGNRWRLFCLEISFIGWSLLAAFFTLGIGYFWLIPYMETSFAAFYREIKAEKYGREEKEETYEGFYNGYTV